MDREVVVMLDGLANGVFGGTALSLCSKVIDEWLAELEQQAGFEPEQRRRWATALDVMTPAVGDGEFPTLRKYSPTWPKLGASLAAARRNQVVQHFFEQMFTGEIVVAPGLEAAVDEILTKLVKNYDDEELPLRREATKHQLVIDVDGMPGSASQKRAEADRRYQAKEESLQVQTNFAAHLTNAAMYQDASGASSATCRYAVSRSRQWVAAGFSDITARDRAAVPSTVDIGCGSWKGSSRDGLDEQRLSADVHSHYASRIEEAVNAVKMTGGTWAAVAIGALFALFIAAQGSGTAFVLALFVLGSVAAYFYFQYQNLDKRRQQARTALETERDGVARVLKAALAELTDLRREIANEDAKADQVLTLLAALSSPQYVLNRPEQARAVIA
jgi:hypothetical protein